MPTRKLPLLPGEESDHRLLVEKVMAEFMAGAIGAYADQHRHQFIVGAQQHFVGIDIDDVDLHADGLRHSLQRVQHVVAQVAVGAGVENETGRVQD